MRREPAIYIMANRRKGTLYTGVTANPPQRVLQHKDAKADSFVARYGCRMLVYYEYYEDMVSAIAREKQIKAGSRVKKIILVESLNPEWRDLFEDFTA